MMDQKRSPRDERFGSGSTGGVNTVAVTWLPAGDYERATTLWPELAASDVDPRT
jgi:hypothetical protein